MSVLDFRARLAALAADDLLRTRRVLDAACGPRAVVDGLQLLAFAGNDYLGLANHPDVVEALREGASRWGAGAGASHLVSGHQRPHEELEAALAAFVGLPRALSFCTGYMANLAVLPALAGRGDTIVADRLNHASLVDAALLSRATVRRYPHNDVAAAARALEGASGRKVVVTDAVFSMDGDIAPLAELLALCERHDALLVIDDAHGFGVLGEHGSGALSQCGIASPRVVYMGTLGKAAGVSGAFVAGDPDLVEWLMQTGRSYRYTTAAPAALACALLASLRIIAAADDR
ncbi:MAG TPA: 8-amino-7-oxononanoate synthase, partial [Methyloversatilis sp.]